MTLNEKAFGLTGAILWGLHMLILTLISAGTNYGRAWLNACVSIYPGYTISVGGSFIGLVYGIIDGFIAFWLIALLYNWLAKKFK